MSNLSISPSSGGIEPSREADSKQKDKIISDPKLKGVDEQVQRSKEGIRIV